MKAKIALLFFFLSGLFRAQQTQFIIGADWLNAFRWSSTSTNDLMGPKYWDTIKSFNLNYGDIAYYGVNESGIDRISRIQSVLNTAYSNGIKLGLNTITYPCLWHVYGGNNQPPLPQRWMYQIESNIDFLTHHYNVGREWPVPPVNFEPEVHWSFVKDTILDHTTCYDLIRGYHSGGTVAEGFNNPDNVPDLQNYFVKLKIRKTEDLNSSNPLITVTLSYTPPGSSTIDLTGYLYSNSLNNGEWVERDVQLFYKSPNGPMAPVNPDTSITFAGVDTSILFRRQNQQVVAGTGTNYEVKIEWSGEVSCQLDYIIFENNSSHYIHLGNDNTKITDTVGYYSSYPALVSYKTWEEPEPENFLVVRYVNRLIKSYLGSNLKYGFSYNWHISSQRYLAQTEVEVEKCDFYPVGKDLPIPGENYYLDSIQSRINWIFIPRLNDAISNCQKFEKKLWLVPQAHEWYNDNALREPSAYEIKLMTNLGIGYGAKGIEYYMFSKPISDTDMAVGAGFLDNDNQTEPGPRYYDAYNFPKWNTIKELNSKIASQGNMLMSLTWKSSYYIHLVLPSGRYVPDGKYITNVQSYFIPVGQNPINYDPVSYTQLSFFDNTTPSADQNKERFYVINRRTLPDDQRTIVITYNKTSRNPNSYQNWTIREVSSNNYWSDGVAGFFQTTYDPAEGKLFTMEPTVFTGGDLIANETISGTNTLSGALSIKPNDTLKVSANSTYTINNNITIDSGGVFVINQGATLNFQNGASLVVRGNLVIGTNAILNIASGDSIDVYGHIICETNLNLPAGSKLKLHNGAILNMNYDDTLFIYGTLTTGIQSDTSTIIGGSIIFEGSSSSGSELNKVHWNNGTCIQCLDGADVTISDCIFNHPGEEIYVYNSTPRIVRNIIYEPYYSGIVCQLGGSWQNEMQINQNIINKTSNNNAYHMYQGIYIYNCDAPIVATNQVSGFSFGLAFSGGSCAFLACDAYINNLITDNQTGILANYGTSLFAGYEDEGFCNYNSIYDNTYNISAYNGSWIEASWNYWNNEHRIFNDGTSDIVIFHDLEYDPWDNEYEKESSNNPIKNSLSANHLSKSMGSDSSSINNPSTGLLLEKQGRISDAILFYKGLIQKGKYVQFAVKQLDKIKNKYSRNEISGYFDGLLTNNNYYTIIEKLVGDTYLKNNQFDNAIAAYDKVIKSNLVGYDGISARFEKLFAYLHIKKDITTASQILSEIKGMNSEDTEVQMRINLAERLIYGSDKVVRKNANTVKDNIPKTYELYQNYPNPFNPITTIKYQIPKPGLVTLKVYDILGKEVAPLVNENKIEGTYNISFDASRFASGIYIYQLRVSEYVSSKKMILLK
jgi:hypothetical protein